jgi:hypothetical protein
MNEMRDIICPQCGSRHGPAAKKCECGQSLMVEEEPAPPKTFFILGIFFALVTVGGSYLADRNGWVYFPLGGILFSSVAFTLGLRSWLWHLRNRGKQ